MVVDAVAIEHRSVPSPVGLAETEEFCESTGQQVHEQTKGGNDATIWKVRQWIHCCYIYRMHWVDARESR